MLYQSVVQMAWFVVLELEWDTPVIIGELGTVNKVKKKGELPPFHDLLLLFKAVSRYSDGCSFSGFHSHRGLIVSFF